MPRSIAPRELAERLSRGERVYLLDVRQPWEHEVAALPNTNMVMPLDQLAERIDELEPQGLPIVVYCHHGIRSLNAAAMLERAGLTDVVSLSGGCDRWSIEIDPKLPRY